MRGNMGNSYPEKNNVDRSEANQKKTKLSANQNQLFYYESIILVNTCNYIYFTFMLQFVSVTTNI